MYSLEILGLSFPLIPFLGLTALALIAAVNALLPGTVTGLTDRLLTRLFIALIISRFMYIGMHWSSYDDLLSMIDIRDRGFHSLTWAVVFVAGLAHLAYHYANMRRRLAGLAGLAILWIAAGYYSCVQLNVSPERWPSSYFRALSVDGNEPASELVRFSDDSDVWRGKTLVNLWATWCPSCRTEMPALQRAQSLHPDVRFIMLNQGETEQQVRDFLNRHEYRFKQVWLDPETSMAAWLGRSALPITLVFDEGGELISGHAGVVSEAVISDLLND